MAIRLNADDFWEFSLAIYCREAVANACLSLQDRRGADVNMLLAICWLARSGYAVSDAALESGLAATAPWAESVLRPLRAVRRSLASFADVGGNDRQSIKHGLLSVELEAERVAQQKIVAALAGHMNGLRAEPARSLAAIGLDLYAAKMSAGEVQDRADLDAILAAL
ncbi:TIGR02444 family protein [Dongia rigui]|uniref:TIGR02444 family protein n=1 Tax=Dongia rigui TaxID=940149 RepID=A0ABU5E1F3_9PROT|nr:TIGR02444 family protein [Dongia rigui]MDY0872733.1 TIGR02444 family protein [Dongia rigui]